MSNHTKQYDNFNEMLIASLIMGRFQQIHNIIRPDFILLLKITESKKSKKKEFDTLYRACLTRFFTLIEADMYGLNQLDMYDGYSDKKDRFIEKFKETYKQICKTWKKEDLQKKYFDSKLQDLIELKKKRDELVHPKKLEHIHEATEEDYLKLESIFESYDKFVNDLMNDFFLSAKISF